MPDIFMSAGTLLPAEELHSRRLCQCTLQTPSFSTAIRSDTVTTTDRSSDGTAPSQAGPDCWDFFDRIYCITLFTRGDRRAQAEKEFAAVGLLDRVRFHVAVRHPTDREEGIFESHMHCLADGLAAGAETILVFEDDVFFQGFDNRKLSRACNYLKKQGPWNGLFLGCIIDGSRRTGERNLAGINYRTLAHAYALHRPFASEFVKNQWSGVPFDELLRRKSSRFYALRPMCAFQGRAGTDNQRVLIDRTRRMLGGLPFIQKTNELYQNHKIPFLLVPALILVAFFALFIRGY